MFIVAFAAISFLAACSGGNKDMIQKKWKFSEMKNPQMDREMKRMNEALAAAIDSIKAAGTDTTRLAKAKNDSASVDSQIKYINEMISKQSEGTIEFMKDGKFLDASGGKSNEGTWTLDEDGKKLIITDAKAEHGDTMIIEEISADKLVFGKDSTTITFVAAVDSSK